MTCSLHTYLWDMFTFYIMRVVVQWVIIIPYNNETSLNYWLVTKTRQNTNQKLKLTGEKFVNQRDYIEIAIAGYLSDHM